MADNDIPTVTRTIPDSTKLPWHHPVVRAVEESVVHVLKRDFGVTSDEARRTRVRVEITRDVRDELRAILSINNPYLAHDPRQIGPMQIMGVSYYVVDTLPEPGWRVIS